LPVALASALATAGAIGGTGSPTPVGFSVEERCVLRRPAFHDAQHRIVVEIRLLDDAVLERDRAVERGRNPKPIPPSSARMLSGLTASAIDRAHTASTLNCVLVDRTSATCATYELNDSCTRHPRPRFRRACRLRLAQSALAASSSTALWRGCLSSSATRGDRVLARRGGKFVDERLGRVAGVRQPTERHHSTGTPTDGECTSTARFEIA
jgi:hypothetical protein